MNYFDVTEACKIGDIELLNVFAEKGFVFDVTCANLACLFNQISVLDYFASFNLFPDNRGRKHAKNLKHEAVIAWLNEHKIE